MGAISEFLNQRKEKWLKNKVKTKMSDMEVEKVKEEAEEKFSIEKWIPDAAKLARQVSLAEGSGIATHVCKFSHPDAKASPVISKCRFRTDGYLHSGNVECELDIFGNAAAAPVFDFLLTAMNDGITVFEHLENDSEEIRHELGCFKESYNNLKADFLALKKDNQEIKSDERIKQVYFPIGKKYHLLSLMTSSGIIRLLHSRINELRGKAIASRDKKSEEYGEKYADIYDLTVTAFGGSKPQNISVLNSRNKGRAYLLPSSPPTILKRELTRPKQDFFDNTLQTKKFRDDFLYLHTLFECDRNNLEIRNKVKKTLNVIVDSVMISVYRIRAFEVGWSAKDSYSQLPLAQKIWLDDSYAEMREENGDWLDDVSISFARWMIRTYEKVLKNDSIMLGDGEAAFLRDQIESALLQDKGSFG